MINSLYSIFSNRSTKWSEVRRQHLLKQPVCQACGTKRGLQVHHIVPYGVNPDLELDPNNLITLCGKYCHFTIGHLMDYKSWNSEVIEDAAKYLEKIQNRPRRIQSLATHRIIDTLRYYMRRLYNYYFQNHE